MIVGTHKSDHAFVLEKNKHDKRTEIQTETIFS